MDNLKAKLESLLLVTHKPLGFKKMSEILSCKPAEIKTCLEELSAEYQNASRGIRLLINNETAQLVSSPENAGLVKQYLKDDLTGELTEPSVETLTIIAYRQPVSKAELEQIRGINCSLILRNLLIRGLVEAEFSRERATTLYSVTLDFLKYLGINSVAELPDYEKLNNDENLLKMVNSETARVETNKEQIFKIEVKKK